jgi:hypothetical protein
MTEVDEGARAQEERRGAQQKSRREERRAEESRGEGRRMIMQLRSVK